MNIVLKCIFVKIEWKKNYLIFIYGLLLSFPSMLNNFQSHGFLTKENRKSTFQIVSLIIFCVLFLQQKSVMFFLK